LLKFVRKEPMAVSGTIENELRAYISSNFLFSESGFPYSDDTSFLQEGLIDSLGVMELVEWVSSAFNIQIRAEEVTAENFDSVSRLAAYIRRKTAPAEAAPVLEETARTHGNGL